MQDFQRSKMRTGYMILKSLAHIKIIKKLREQKLFQVFFGEHCGESHLQGGRLGVCFLPHLRSGERRFNRWHGELDMCPLWLREHSGLVQGDYMENLKGRDQPLGALIAGIKERWLCWLTSLSILCWAKNTENICHGPDMGCARENWPRVWGSKCYQGLFLLSPFLRVVFCVFSLFSDQPSLCNYKMDVRSSWVNPLLASKPVQQSKSLYPTLLSTRREMCFYQTGLCHILGREQWPG